MHPDGPDSSKSDHHFLSLCPILPTLRSDDLHRPSPTFSISSNLLDQRRVRRYRGLAAVAGFAGRNQVGRFVCTSERFRNDVIDTQFDGCGGQAAVSAAELITPEDLEAEAFGDGHDLPYSASRSSVLTICWRL